MSTGLGEVFRMLGPCRDAYVVYIALQWLWVGILKPIFRPPLEGLQKQKETSSSAKKKKKFPSKN